MSAEPQAANDQWTVNRLLTWTTDYLGKAGLDEPRLAAELLLAHALGWAKIDLYARFDHQPAEAERTSFRELVRAAAEHQPVAYLIGRKEFYSLAFEVTPDVLIPRPETETLVDRAIDCCRGLDVPEPCLLDLGTGSGCVVVAVLTRVTEARAVAVDVSADALEVARRNAETHGVADRIEFVEADGLALPEGCVPEGGFDLIVSNPPYVADDELETLPANVRRYEPHLALSAGADGLRFYRLLHDDGPDRLRPGGSVFVELGANMGDAVIETFQAGEVFVHAGTWHDPTDPHDRVMQFVRTSEDGA